MRKLFILLFFLSCSVSAFAQSVMPTDSATGKIMFTEVVQAPGVSQAELYSRAREWFATNFNSAEAVLEMEDKDSGKLIGSAFQDVYIKTPLMPVKTRVWYMIKLYLKEGRYKYEITNLAHQGYYSSSNKYFSYDQQTTKYPAEPVFEKKNALNKKGEMKAVNKSYYDNDLAVVNGLISSFKKALDGQATKQKEW